MAILNRTEPVKRIEGLLEELHCPKTGFRKLIADINHKIFFVKFVISVKLSPLKHALLDKKLKMSKYSTVLLTSIIGSKTETSKLPKVEPEITKDKISTGNSVITENIFDTTGLKHLMKDIEKLVTYKKNGILVNRKVNNRNMFQFIRIATISDPVKIEFKPYDSTDRSKLDRKFNNFQSFRNNKEINPKTYEKKYDDFIREIRRTVPISYPKTLNYDIDDWSKKCYAKNKAESIVEELDNLIMQGVEIIYVLNEKKNEEYRSLFILIEYGPLHQNDDFVLKRSSVLDLYHPLHNYQKLIYLNYYKGRINLMGTTGGSHEQALTHTKNMLSKLIHQNAERQFTDPVDLNSIGVLSQTPNNCVLSIPVNMGENNSTDLNSFTKFNYLNLHKNRPIYIESSRSDFVQVVNSYEFLRNDKHKILIFSNRSWNNFIKIPIDDLRLSLVSFESIDQIKDFMNVYKSIDMVYGDKGETGFSDIFNFFDTMQQYDKETLVPIKNIDIFIELLGKQLTNNAYLGNSKLISKIFQIFRQYNLRRVMDPADDMSFEDSIYFPTVHNSSEIYLSIILLLEKINRIKKLKGDNWSDTTLIIDDPRLLKILADKNNYRFFTNFTEKLDGLRLILHSSSARQYAAFNKIPRLVIKKQGSRKRSTLHYESMKIDVDPIIYQEVIA